MTDHQLHFADFAGLWQVDRQIDDRLGRAMTFTGTALLTGDDKAMTYREQGQLVAGKGPGFAATRRYEWRTEGTDIAVCFDDGRPFHRFDPMSVTASASHDCAPDIYQVRYDFFAWPVWSTRWRVSGPRKDYTMDTTYRRTG